MSLLSAYGGEEVTWRPGGDPDKDQTITVLWVDEIKKIPNASSEAEIGEDLLQIAFIQCTALVQQDDIIIRGGYHWPVLAIDRTLVFGREQFRIARLGQRMI
jgi:hypothetical protein